MGKCSVYKYVHQDKVIYIGKSDSNYQDRIRCHSNESKFLPYLNDCEIYFAKLPNPAFTCIYETYLINKYKPVLNDKMKYNKLMEFDLPEIEWQKVYPVEVPIKDDLSEWRNQKISEEAINYLKLIVNKPLDAHEKFLLDKALNIRCINMRRLERMTDSQNSFLKKVGFKIVCQQDGTARNRTWTVTEIED